MVVAAQNGWGRGNGGGGVGLQAFEEKKID